MSTTGLLVTSPSGHLAEHTDLKWLMVGFAMVYTGDTWTLNLFTHVETSVFEVMAGLVHDPSSGFPEADG